MGGRDEEARPAGTGKDPARGRQERPVGVAQLRAVDLAAQDREFVTQHHDLEFLVSLGTEPQHHDCEDTPRYDVEEGEDHRRNLRSSDRRSRTYGEVTTVAPRHHRRRLLPSAVLTAELGFGTPQVERPKTSEAGVGGRARRVADLSHVAPNASRRTSTSTGSTIRDRMPGVDVGDLAIPQLTHAVTPAAPLGRRHHERDVVAGV